MVLYVDMFEVGFGARCEYSGEELQQGEDRREPWDIGLEVEPGRVPKDRWYWTAKRVSCTYVRIRTWSVQIPRGLLGRRALVN